MKDRGPMVVGAQEFQSDATVKTSVVGILKARDVQLVGAGAGFVGARGGLSIESGGCGAVVTNGAVTIRYGGCGPVIANGDVAIETGGAQAILASGGATIGRNAFAGIVVSPRVTVEAGGRVLTSSPLAVVLGVCAGLAIAVLPRLMRRSPAAG
jgi:hypothetical protein